MDKQLTVDKKQRTTIYLPINYHERLKIEAVMSRTTMGDIIAEWIEKYLVKPNKK